MRKLIMATASMVVMVSSAQAGQIMISNRSDGTITGFRINGFYHPVHIPPHTSRMTGATTESCGPKNLVAITTDGPDWRDTKNICTRPSETYTWDLIDN